MLTTNVPLQGLPVHSQTNIQSTTATVSPNQTSEKQIGQKKYQSICLIFRVGECEMMRKNKRSKGFI